MKRIPFVHVCNLNFPSCFVLSGLPEILFTFEDIIKIGSVWQSARVRKNYQYH